MTFDCSKCLAHCKADCCHGPVPMSRVWADAQKPIRPIVERTEIGNDIVILLAVDERTRNLKAPDSIMGVCPFLGLDDRCSVYDTRPEVCREFGSESHSMMICSYQAKDGRVRSRQERRFTERVTFAARDRLMDRLKKEVAK